MDLALTVDKRELDGFEGLQEAVKGSHFDITQLGRGKMSGSVSHIGIGDFTLSLSTFDRGISAQRTAADEQILVGMLLSAAGRVTHWSFDLRPGDIVIIPPLAEHHAVHRDAASYAVIRLNPGEIPALFDEPRLRDEETWQEKKRCRASHAIAVNATQILSRLATHLDSRSDTALSEGAADFWKRTIADCMAMTIQNSLPAEKDSHLPPTLKLVRLMVDYLQTKGDRPVHVSEISTAVGLSRRSLHRWFHEIFGTGPVTFLRRRRLCAAYSALKANSPLTTTVGDVAIEHGFIELGRFSHDYHVMFGEYPSQTLNAYPRVPAKLAGTFVPRAKRRRPLSTPALAP
jgi:AraC-like DNA-binding protein